MKSFSNRSARVNLTERTWAVEHLSDEVSSRLCPQCCAEVSLSVFLK